MAIRISKDRKLDVAYVQFRVGKIDKSVEVRPGVLLDLDSKGNVMGIEVLSVSTLAPVLRAIPRSAKANRRAA